MKLNNRIPFYSKLLLSCLFFIPLCLEAQHRKDDFTYWYIYNLNTSLSKQWKSKASFQYRSYEFVPDTKFIIASLEAGYTFPNTNFNIGGGYFYQSTHPYNKKQDKKLSSFGEHRAFEFISYSHSLDNTKLAHRFSIEQRWMKQKNFRIRYRYRLSASIPIKIKQNKTRWGLSSYAEILLNDKNGKAYDSSKFYAGLTYNISKNLNLNAGWMLTSLKRRNEQSVVISLNHKLF